MEHLDTVAQCACAALMLPLMEDANIVDQLTRQGVDVKQLQQMLQNVQDNLSTLNTVHLDTTTSSYDSRSRRKEQDEVSRDISALLRAFGNKTLSGQDLMETLMKCPKANVVTFIIEEIAGWTPNKRRKGHVPST